MKIFLQTRGRNHDYTFLGDAPGEIWWAQYRNQTSFEDPTIVVHSSENGGRVCLSGIASVRKDRVGTTIRYTLVFEDAHHNEQAENVVNVIGLWLQAAADRKPFGPVQEALDGEFPEVLVEKVIVDHGRSFTPKVSDLVHRALLSLPKSTVSTVPAESSAPDSSWLGSVNMPAARTAFMQRVRELLLDRQLGRALLLNLLGTKNEAQDIVNKGAAAAILIEDLTDEDLTDEDEIVSLEKKVLTAPQPSKSSTIPIIQNQQGKKIANCSSIPASKNTSIPTTNRSNQTNTRKMMFWVASLLLVMLLFWLMLSTRSEKNNLNQTLPLRVSAITDA